MPDALPQRLFVYGTLAPGQPNEHRLAGLGGRWRPASVRGRLYPEGWGAALGYPGIVLDEAGPWVDGHLFESERLASTWEALDDFEGEGYRRIATTVTFRDGSTTTAFVYVLSETPCPPFS